MMDLKTCLEILELGPKASPEEAKQAYKDLVNVWHPDRFSGNTRLRERAEKKLKEINLAYETVAAHLESGGAERPQPEEDGSPYGEGPQDPQSTGRRNRSPNGHRHTTEAAFETGTFVVLNTWSRLTNAIRGFVTEMKKAANEDDSDPPPRNQARSRGQGRGDGWGSGHGRGMGKGRGPGRGGGGGRRR